MNTVVIALLGFFFLILFVACDKLDKKNIIMPMEFLNAMPDTDWIRGDLLKTRIEAQAGHRVDPPFLQFIAVRLEKDGAIEKDPKSTDCLKAKFRRIQPTNTRT